MIRNILFFVIFSLTFSKNFSMEINEQKGLEKQICEYSPYLDNLQKDDFWDFIGDFNQTTQELTIKMYYLELLSKASTQIYSYYEDIFGCNKFGFDKTRSEDHARKILELLKKYIKHQNSIAANNNHALDKFAYFVKFTTEVDQDGNTILHICASNEKLIDCMEQFLKIETSKKLIDQKNNIGETALHIAVKNNNIGTMKKLLEYGANYRIKNKEHQSVIQIAHSKELADLKLELKETIFEKNQNEKCPICFENKRDCLTPCCVTVLCAECAQKVQSQSKMCPFCRLII